MSELGSKVVPILGILAGVLSLLATALAARGMPRIGADIKPGSPSCYGIAEINGTRYNVKYLVDENTLHVISIWPRFVVALDMNELRLERKPALIGTQVKITPLDLGEWRVFKEMVMSHFSAKRIEKMSKGAFGYSRIGKVSANSA